MPLQHKWSGHQFCSQEKGSNGVKKARNFLLMMHDDAGKSCVCVCECVCVCHMCVKYILRIPFILKCKQKLRLQSKTLKKERMKKLMPLQESFQYFLMQWKFNFHIFLHCNHRRKRNVFADRIVTPTHNTICTKFRVHSCMSRTTEQQH